MRRLEQIVNGRATVYAACGASLAIGLVFVFGWAPHPWGWEGFDHYHQLALTIASGHPFPTMEVPWGYAYFLAAFYRLVGDHPAVPLVIQVVLNACVPLLVFRAARVWFDTRTATLAAVLTGVCSFNTVYASTQSSDAICTVIFMIAVVAFLEALGRDRWSWFALVGVLTGLAPQFRPNLILIPALLAAYAIAERRTRRRILQAGLLLACAAAALTPWVVRNYRLTRTVLPTSVHAGVQLWYGTLQVGPYLHSRAYNPRSIFETPVFDYTSLEDVPLVVSGELPLCADHRPSAASLVYWTDLDATRRRGRLTGVDDRQLSFEIPPPLSDAIIYYYFELTWPSGAEPLVTTTPAAGSAAPRVYFVSQNHLGDLDVHGDLLDIFDIVRMMRYAAWGEPLPFARELEHAGIPSGDLNHAVAWLGHPDLWNAMAPEAFVIAFDHDEARARVTLRDRSSITVPRRWSGRITDVMFDGLYATRLMWSTSSLATLRDRLNPPPPADADGCRDMARVAINRVFYRDEPHMMRRYWALALDNIRREPLAFAAATAYRVYRLFLIEGSADPHTAQQFAGSTRVYALATVASVAYLLLFLVGIVAAWLRRAAVYLPLLLIAYVPATIAFVLTNMRYSITVQPLVFMFVASALMAFLEHAGLLEAPTGAADRGRTRTARQF